MSSEIELEFESGRVLKCSLFYKAIHCLIVLSDGKVYLVNRYKIKGPLGYLDEVTHNFSENSLSKDEVSEVQ